MLGERWDCFSGLMATPVEASDLDGINEHAANTHIAMFYNPKRRHSYGGNVSPVLFEQQYFNRLESV